MNNPEIRVKIERQGDHIEIQFPLLPERDATPGSIPLDQDDTDVEVLVVGLSLSGARKLAHDILKELDVD